MYQENIAKPNYSKRTFTIRKGGWAKIRTEKFSKEEFEKHLNNNSNDWQAYLNTSKSYTTIKRKRK